MNASSIRIDLLRARWRLAAMSLQIKLVRLRLALKAGFDPNQPRVPAGNPDGGRWTDAGSASAGGSNRYDRSQSADADGSFTVAQASGRGPGSRGRAGGPPLTPSQLTRLEVSQARADAAVARVRNIDPNWSPRPGLNQTVDGQIANNRAIEREANSRYIAVRTEQVLFGPYTGGKAVGPGAFKRPTEAQRAEVDRLGALFGCHTCGARDPATRSGRWIFDHQTPSALGGPGAGRLGGPHCSACRAWSGGVISNIRKLSK